tara:strand:+ start:151500 stop:152813 length:1314 start_codon:yes stop_codon:yes gene_type:complete
MINIETSSKNLPEKEYIIHFVFTELFETKYLININEDEENIKIISQDFELTVISKYFSLDDLINVNSLPINSHILRSKYLEDNLPIFYGQPSIDENNNQITINFDLFGIIFFMLTRWEEYVSPTRDEHNRFPAKESFAFKMNFIQRPIVNELAILLYNIFRSYKVNISLRNNYDVFLTHDIDHLYYPKSPRKFVGDIVKRRSLNSFFNRVKYSFNSPYNCISWISDLNQKNKIKSEFYFMAAYGTPFNNDYKINDPNILESIKTILKNNQTIGIHPSYKTLNNYELLIKEKNALENTFKLKIQDGRQHFLRFSSPQTWLDWEKASLKIDSSLGYPEVTGFRCGTGNEFYCYDFLNRKVLKLKERPLIFMDTSARYYQSLSLSETFDQIKLYKTTCQRYSTPFTLLFHNSSFEEIEWIGFKNKYIEILSLLSDTGLQN